MPQGIGGFAVGPPDSNSNTTSTSSCRPRPPGWVHFVAGGLGGMCGATVTAPFDLVKTRLQSSLYPIDHPTSAVPRHGQAQNLHRLFYHFIDTGKIIRVIHREEGFRALFRGLGPTLAGAIPARAINFYAYGTGKDFYGRILAPYTSSSSSIIHMCSAITAGIATSTATNPIWVVKTRLQLDQHATNPTPSSTINSTTTRHIHTYSTAIRSNPQTSIVPQPRAYCNQPGSILSPFGSSVRCITQIYRHEGITGFYRGLSASYLGVAEGTIQWTLYEKFKSWSRHFDAGDRQDDGQETWIGKMVAAGTAKLIATGITYPHEVVRTRMRQNPPPPPLRPKYDGLLLTFRTIFAEEGLKAFYGGLSPHLLRVVPNAAVMYTVYELALSLSQKSK